VVLQLIQDLPITKLSLLRTDPLIEKKLLHIGYKILLFGTLQGTPFPEVAASQSNTKICFFFIPFTKLH